MDMNTKTLKKWINSNPDGEIQRSVQHKMSPFIKGQQAFGQAVQSLVTDGSLREFQLVKSVYKKHANAPVPRTLSIDSSDSGLPDNIQHEQSYNRVRTFSGDSQNSVEEELCFLRKKVEEQETTMESLKISMLRLKEESECHKLGVDRIEKRFHGHRVLIDRTLQQTQLALQDQQEILCRQEVLVHKLEKERKLGGSIFMESFSILVGMYVIQTPLVKYTIQLISMRFDQHGRNRKWLPRFLQIVFFMHFVKLCKSFDSYFGFTSGISSLFSWTGHALQDVINRLTRHRAYNSISYSSNALKDWTNSTSAADIGLNSIGQQSIVPNDKIEQSTAKPLNIC